MANRNILEESTEEKISYFMGLMLEDAEREIGKIEDSVFLEALRMRCFEKDNRGLQKIVEKKIGPLGA